MDTTTGFLPAVEGKILGGDQSDRDWEEIQFRDQRCSNLRRWWVGEALRPFRHVWKMEGELVETDESLSEEQGKLHTCGLPSQSKMAKKRFSGKGQNGEVPPKRRDCQIGL